MYKINVLEKGWVEVQSVSGSDTSIVFDVTEPMFHKTGSDLAGKKVIFDLLQKEDMQPFKNAEITFRVKAPFSVMLEWLKIDGWRFEEIVETEDFYVPRAWRKQRTVQSVSGPVNACTNHDLNKLLEKHLDRSNNLFEMAVEQGVSKEQAKLFLLGYGTYYQFTATANVANLIKFFDRWHKSGLRSDIDDYAAAMFVYHFKRLFSYTAEATSLFVLNKK